MIMMLVFSLLMIISFSESFEDFFIETDLKKLRESDDSNLKTLSDFLIYWNNVQSNYAVYSDTNPDIVNFINYDDSQLSLVKKLKYFEQNKSDSIYLMGIELYFLDRYWRRTKDVNVVNRIFELNDSINNYYGKELPRNSIIISNIYWNSNIYGDREKSYEIMKSQVENFPNQKEVIDIFSEMSFILKKTDYVDKLYAHYNLNSDYNEKTILYFIYAFLENGERDKAIELSNSLFLNSTNQYNKAKAYEFLGDHTEDLPTKVDYYRKSLDERVSSGEVLGKIGVSLYRLDPEKNSETSRAYLNSATAYGNYSEDVVDILAKLRAKVIFKNFMIFMLPLIAITGIGIYLIVKWERWKRDDDLGKHILDNN